MASLAVWGADSANSVTNSYGYNNTIYLDDKNLVNGTPAAVTFLDYFDFTDKVTDIGGNALPKD